MTVLDHTQTNAPLMKAMRIEDLRNQGFTSRQICEKFGVSRTRIFQLEKRLECRRYHDACILEDLFDRHDMSELL